MGPFLLAYRPIYALGDRKNCRPRRKFTRPNCVFRRLSRAFRRPNAVFCGGLPLIFPKLSAAQKTDDWERLVTT